MNRDVGADPFRRHELDRPVAARFATQVARHGMRVAVRAGGDTLTYGALDVLANRVAHAILARDLPPPHTVALLVAHGTTGPVAALGATKAGVTWVQLQPDEPEARNAFILADAAARLIVTDRRHAALARRLAARDRPAAGVIVVEETQDFAAHDPAAVPPADRPTLLKYTSGSTGRPKGACLPPRAVLHAAMVYATLAGLRPDDRVSSLGSALGPRELYCVLLNGAALCRFDVQGEGTARLAAWLEHERITWLVAVPTVFRSLCHHMPPGHRLDGVRLVRLSGEPVTQTEWQYFRSRFSSRARLYVGLGSTEAHTYRAALFDWADTPTEPVLPLDLAIEDKEVDVLDPTGRPVPPGEIGEVTVRSQFLFSGYWRRPDLTAAVLTRDPHSPRRRAFRTGDLVRRLPDGRLVHVGRCDGQVKVSGNRIEIGEVEQALRRVPGVRDAALAPRQCARGQVRLVAFCAVDGDPPGRRELRAQLREWVPEAMLPAAFVMVDELPTLPGGKVDRATLAARAAAATSSDPRPPRNPIEETLIEIWQRALGVTAIGVSDHLFLDLGGDSLAAVEIVNAVASICGRELPLAVLHTEPTVEGVARCLASDWRPPADGRLVLHAGGSEPPLFALCGAFGHALRLVLVGHALGDAQPFCALQPPHMDWTTAGCRTIEEMAAHYVREIRAFRPRGPYRLLGTSFGGVVAFEIAVQLQRAGERVELLAMVDSGVPAIVAPDGIDRVAYRDFTAGSDTTDRLVAMGVTVARQHRAALEAYVLRERFDGTLVYFKCLGSSPTPDRRPLWGRFAAGGMRVLPVPGPHGNFHREPQFSALVGGLRDELARLATGR